MTMHHTPPSQHAEHALWGHASRAIRLLTIVGLMYPASSYAQDTAPAETPPEATVAEASPETATAEAAPEATMAETSPETATAHPETTVAEPPLRERDVARTREGQAKQEISASVSLAGAINISTNGDLFYINFGGPNIKLQIDDFRFHLSFFPSLRLYPDQVAFALGGGPVIGYKNFQLVMPIYIVAEEIKPTFGVGYAF